MHTTQEISLEQVHEIIGAIFGQGTVVVKQAYSDFDCPAREFGDAKALIDDLAYQPGQKVALFTYAIYYPGARGHVYEKKIALQPESCNGHTFRFTQEGWGLIHFWCGFRNYPTIECSITVNSRARAVKWYDVKPDYRDPELWDWQVIEKKAGRLVRLLRKCGKEAEQRRNNRINPRS